MKLDWDKCLLLRGKDGSIIGIVIHDIENRRKIFFKVEEMDMEAIKELLEKQ